MTGRSRPFYKGRAREGEEGDARADNCSGREKLQSANARGGGLLTGRGVSNYVV